MTNNLVDAHCHLDLYSDFAAAIDECERHKIYTLTVTTTPKAWPHNHGMVQRARYVRVALGLHPQLIAERANELALWEEYLPQARFIGEVGLDAGPRFYRSLKQQKMVFGRILKLCAKAGGKILSVHSARAATMVLDMIETNLPPERGLVVLHWFSGSIAEARRAIELGCYFSINSEMLRKDRSRMLVKALPLDRLLTETDGPFIQSKGQPIKPLDVSITVNKIASMLNSEPSEIASAVCMNFRKFLTILGNY
jgi:TatD DNase family protein